MRLAGFFLVTCVACKGADATPDAAIASASASVAVDPPAPTDTHGKWWPVATKSRVYTPERLTDADNAIRLVPSPNREIIVRALNNMAAEPATGEGLRAAGQLARDAQDQVDDAHNPAARVAIATAGLIVLHGLVARACLDHPSDLAVLTPVMASIREMPLPRLEKGDGRTERNIMEQEMRTALDDKTMKTLLASAPAPKKS